MKNLFAFFFLLTAFAAFPNSQDARTGIQSFQLTGNPIVDTPVKMVAEPGVVKWFNDIKGYGFLVREGGGEVFVHHASIIADGFKTLSEGDRVFFEIVEGPKGLQAKNVVKIP